MCLSPRFALLCQGLTKHTLRGCAGTQHGGQAQVPNLHHTLAAVDEDVVTLCKAMLSAWG